MDSQFQPVTNLSVQDDIEMVGVALRSYILSPAIEPPVKHPDEVHETIRGLKVSKAPDTNGLPNNALKHRPK